MNKIRVLLAEVPPVWRDVFKGVADQLDVEFVGDLTDPLALLLATGQTRADVVVLSLLHGSELPGVCSHLFNEYPHVKVLGVQRDGRGAYLYGLGIQRVPVSDVSAQGLLEAVLAAMRTHSV